MERRHVKCGWLGLRVVNWIVANATHVVRDLQILLNQGLEFVSEAAAGDLELGKAELELVLPAEPEWLGLPSRGLVVVVDLKADLRGLVLLLTDRPRVV